MDKIPYAGQMDTKVQVYRNDITKDNLGANVVAAVLLCDTWASTDSMVGDMQADDKVRHIVTTQFTIRKREGIFGVDNLEVQADGLRYKVNHVRKIQRSHLVLICKNYD